MNKTILIPIDFTVASLNTLKLALEHLKGHEVKVLLVYSEFLDNSISDLLFYSPQNMIASKITTEFSEALEIIKNKNGDSLKEIEIKLIHSNRLAYISHFLEANNIEEIFLPGNYRLKTGDKGFDPGAPLLKAGLPVSHMSWRINNYPTEHEQLIALFN